MLSFSFGNNDGVLRREKMKILCNVSIKEPLRQMAI